MSYTPINPNGQKTMADSEPVVIASDQTVIPVSLSSIPLPTGAAQDGTDITTPTAMPVGGVGIRGWLSAIWTKLNGSLTVTGSFFQATQPVSLATNTPILQTGSNVIGSISNTAFTANAGTNLNTSALALEAGNLATIKTNTDKIPALGQALAAASTPVVLTTIQQAALTPPAAISGFNLESTQLLVKAKTDNIPVQGQALAANSLPVVLTAAQVSTLTPPAQITGYALAANQQTDALTNTQIRATALPVSGAFFQTTQPVSGTVTANTGLAQPLTDAQIRATSLPVSGSVTANVGTTNGLALDVTLTNGTTKAILRTATKGTTPGADTTSSAIDANTQALDVSVKNNVSVIGAFFQTTQPVSLTSTTVTNTVDVSATSLPLPTGAASAANQQTNAITDLQIRATPLPISGTVSTGGLTDTQLRATALPISGTVSTGGLTDTQIRATPLPISGTVSTGLTQPLTDAQLRATAISTLTPAEGLVSTGNSTVTNLAANAVFTGVAEDITVYSNIKVNIYSSHASAIDGLNYQQSHDGVLWFSMDLYTIPAGTQKTFSTSANMKFFRVVYTNGATATTQFIIQVLYHKSDKQASSVKPQDGRGNDNDFTEELSFLMGYNGTSWDRIRSSLKGVQGLNALNTQDLKDSGRSNVTFYTLIPVLSSATDTLQSLTATRSNATVAATATPSVVTTGKTLRVTKLSASYVATATSGYAMVRLRFNTTGVVVISSSVATTLVIGAHNPATANSANTVEVPFSEGMEFAAGTGLGISVQGFAAATATAVGYVLVSLTGYEY